jgi:hypothetical protein
VRQAVSNGQEFDHALQALMSTLQTYLPAPAPPLPAGSVGVASVADRALSVGNLRGDETRSGIGTVCLKGGRIDALVRFQLWGQQPGDAEKAIQALAQKVLADRNKLWAQGFLKLALANTPVPENITGMNLWRDSAEFNVLYEYHFQEADGEGLIARIPVHLNSVHDESTVVTAEMRRWDDQNASTLVLRGRTEVGRISVLDFAPAAKPAGTVTLLRTRDDATSVPGSQASLAAFLSAVTGDNPGQVHAQFVFTSWTNFLAALTANPELVTLGTDQYTPREIAFDPAIKLPGAADRFEIRYEHPAFEQVAVAYLRTQRG